jgi:hypothetical protein
MPSFHLYAPGFEPSVVPSINRPSFQIIRFPLEYEADFLEALNQAYQQGWSCAQPVTIAPGLAGLQFFALLQRQGT